MFNQRRSAILRLATHAQETGLDVATGVLQQNETGRWLLGSRDLLTWLGEHEGEDLVLVLGSLADDRPVAVRTCGTCGRDYQDVECPTCRGNRMRLRGY